MEKDQDIMSPQRLPRREYFMNMAEEAAKMGTCSRGTVGCILTDGKKIISTGYNSSHRGTPHCQDIGCLMEGDHCLRCLHAEEAAILNLEKRFEFIIAYITLRPCLHCYKLLTGAGIKTIFYRKEYGNNSKAYDILRDAIGVPLTKI